MPITVVDLNLLNLYKYATRVHLHVTVTVTDIIRAAPHASVRMLLYFTAVIFFSFPPA